MARKTILPVFLPRSSLLAMARPQMVTTIPGPIEINEEIDFLLCNVPNYNLTRLYQCELDSGFQFSLSDSPLPLEIFLQMYVDLFYLKTCSFRQGQPRAFRDKNGQQTLEGIFIVGRQPTKGRYGLTPCNRNNCGCCKNQATSIQFDLKQIHCFLNQYQAVLNCPVVNHSLLSFIHSFTLNISLRRHDHINIIGHALTCPCGEKHYVAHKNSSFFDCLTYHRREIVRTIRECLLGDANIHLIELQSKTEEIKANDENWLYLHSADVLH